MERPSNNNNNNNNEEDDDVELLHVGKEVTIMESKFDKKKGMYILDLTQPVVSIGGAGPVTVENAGVPVHPLSKETKEQREERHKLIMGQAKSAYQEYLAMSKDKNWTIIPYNGAPDISCYELPDKKLEDGSTVYTIRAIGTVKGKTADSIAEAHMDTNEVSRKAWDGKMISSIKTIDTITDTGSGGTKSKSNIQLTVQRATHNPGIPTVAEREFVQLHWSHRKESTKNKSDHEWVLITHYTEHPDYPVQSSPVRALSMSVMVLKPLTPDKSGLLSIPTTSVTLMGWAQPGGYLPDGVVKMYKTVFGDRIKFLRETMFV